MIEELLFRYFIGWFVFYRRNLDQHHYLMLKNDYLEMLWMMKVSFFLVRMSNFYSILK